jgi:hypothetical protein
MQTGSLEECNGVVTHLLKHMQPSSAKCSCYRAH